MTADTFNPDAEVTVETGICVVCKTVGTVTLTKDEYFALNNEGKHVQEALSERSEDIREQVISGTHGECFDKLFAGMDD